MWLLLLLSYTILLTVQLRRKRLSSVSKSDLKVFKWTFLWVGSEFRFISCRSKILLSHIDHPLQWCFDATAADFLHHWDLRVRIFFISLFIIFIIPCHLRTFMKLYEFTVCSETKLPLAKFSFGWWWIADHSTDY